MPVWYFVEYIIYENGKLMHKYEKMTWKQLAQLHKLERKKLAKVLFQEKLSKYGFKGFFRYASKRYDKGEHLHH
jgi:hypothetical protein